MTEPTLWKITTPMSRHSWFTDDPKEVAHFSLPDQGHKIEGYALSASPATAEPVQQDTRDEAVAWMVKWYGSDGHEFVNATASKLVAQQHALRVGGKVIDLYATPHPVQPEEALARELRLTIVSLRALADHVRACPDYVNLRGDMVNVDKAIAALSPRAKG